MVKLKLRHPSIIVQLGLFFSFCLLTLIGIGQNDLENHKKYWYYKSRLNNDFILVGNTPTNQNNNAGHGESMPFNERIPSSIAPWDSLVPDLKSGDEAARLGIYLSVLSTEYRLLKNNNANNKQIDAINRVKHEIFCALNAINRIDYYAEEQLWPNATPNLNGFFIRGDHPKDFVINNYEHFNYRNKGTHINVQGIYSPNLLYNGVPVDINLPPQLDSGFTQTSPIGITKSGGTYPDEVSEESQDQAYYLLMGLALTAKLVDQPETDGNNVFGYGSQETSLSVEAGKIADRIIKHIKSDPLWKIKNPNTGNDVSIGENAIAYAYPLDNLGCFINYQTDMPNWYIPYVSIPGAYPLNNCTDYRNLYSSSPYAFASWQVLSEQGGSPPVDAQGFFQILAGLSNSVYKDITVIDLNVQQQIAEINQLIINATQNAQQQIQNILGNLPNIVPNWLQALTQLAINAINTALNVFVLANQALINTLITYLNVNIKINNTDQALLYNSLYNPVTYFNKCLYPPIIINNEEVNTPITHYGSELYFGTYLRDILHGYNFSLPNNFQFLNNPPALAHNTIKSTVEGILNTAPCEGNYNKYPSSYPSAAFWGASNFLDRPDRLWNKTTCPEFLGEYSGTDYMLLHNLYYLTEGTDFPIEDYIDRKAVTNYPNGNSFIVPNKKTFGSFEKIHAYNTIASNGAAEYRSGKEIALLPSGSGGFSASNGSDFNAIIRFYPCSGYSENMNKGSLPSDDFSSNSNENVQTSYVKGDTINRNFTSFKEKFNPQLDSINFIYNNIMEKINTYKNIEIYPNPNSGKFWIDIHQNTDEHFDITISDVIGNIVYSEKYLTGVLELPVDLTLLSKGIYLVNIRYSSGLTDARRVSVN
ncbi:MAG: T9SS type A sorting domain-containing protein [Sphingobacteriaceae bacterium]|nr:T9SS type A sorting domain-containing protein [Sphingobacteriaceae bacterium]